MKKFNKTYLNDALSAIHFIRLTDVQKHVIEQEEKHRDLIVEAKTGSGKTHAFLLPILDNLDEDDNSVQALIIAPTRELALQIYRFTTELTQYAPKEIKINLVTGGNDRQQTIDQLDSRQPHIVIGTPGRIHDLVFKENVLKIYTAKYFIIDEADMALDDHFIVEMSEIAGVVENARKMVFSATIPEKILPFLKKYLNHPYAINVHPDEISNLNIDHYLIKTKEKPRLEILEQVIDAINPYLAIVFCNTKESAEEVFQWMNERQENAVLFHGGLNHRRRKQLIRRINQLDFQYIIATDILARGIDIVGVSHVINYELPRDIEFYIHRSGRTGRIDMDGICISLYEFDDNQYLDALENKGVMTSYKTIKGHQFIDAKERQARSKRDWKDNKIDRIAKSKVKKPKKVKPGYKKKYKQKVEIEKKKLHRKMKK